MITSTSFYYDGIYSEDMGVIKVRVGGGLVTDSFLSPVSVNQVKLKNSNKARIQTIDREPLTIPMALFFDENLSEESIRRVKNWLSKEDYRELRFENEPEKVYYAVLSGTSELTHNAVASGYVQLELLTNSSYSFSNVFTIEGISNETDFSYVSIHNYGDEIAPTDIAVTMINNSTSDIEIYNETTQENLKLVGNLANEEIVFMGEYEEIHTSSNLRHRYNDHNGVFISLQVGENRLRVKGDFKYKIEAQFIYK